MTHLSAPQRRTLLKAGLFVAPAALTVTSLTSAQAAEAQEEQQPTLSVEFSEPTIDWASFEPTKDTPIFRAEDGTHAFSYGSLPQTMTITNNGKEAVSNPSGTFITQMKDVGTDAPSAAIIGTQVNSTDPHIAFIYGGQAKPHGPKYTWVYSGSIQPGESVEIPLRYYVTYPFANVDYELYVEATVDSPNGAPAAKDTRMGTVKGFAIYW